MSVVRPDSAPCQEGAYTEQMNMGCGDSESLMAAPADATEIYC